MLIMEVEFDTRFKHPWSMILSGPSSSGKTVFTKQVLNKSDKQFEKDILVLFRMARRIQRLLGNQLCVGHAILAGRVLMNVFGKIKHIIFVDFMPF